MSIVPHHDKDYDGYRIEVPTDGHGHIIDQDDIGLPSWTIVYADGRIVRGNPGEWYQYAEIEPVDSIQGYVLTDPAVSVIMHPDTGSRFHRDIALNAPEPVQFFSFAQYQMPLIGFTQWKYSVFGYLLADYRVYATILPSHYEVNCERRDTPFILL